VDRPESNTTRTYTHSTAPLFPSPTCTQPPPLNPLQCSGPHCPPVVTLFRERHRLVPLQLAGAPVALRG
jgi:hypothetical protein